MSLKRPDLTNLSPEQLEYVKSLENALHGSTDIVQSLNIAMAVIAEEVNEIVGKGDILNSPSFDRLVVLIDKHTKIMALTKSKTLSQPQIEEETTTTSDIELLEDIGNIFEKISKKAREKVHG